MFARCEMAHRELLRVDHDLDQDVDDPLLPAGAHFGAELGLLESERQNVEQFVRVELEQSAQVRVRRLLLISPLAVQASQARKHLQSINNQCPQPFLLELTNKLPGA